MNTIVFIIPGTHQELNWWGITALILVGVLTVWMTLTMWSNRG